tara:strand:+ start:320 stop:847 length:528 start_codon:yes stop_codon:yes gene_type:complete
MIQWPKLQLDTTQFLLNQEAKDTDESAIFFGKTYHAAMKIAADPNKNLVILKDVDILIDAWKKVFSILLESPKDLKAIPYNIIGGAMIQFWTGAALSPLIPASGMASGLTNLIVFPGNPVPVGKGIYDAFNKKEAPLVSGALIKVYKDHASTISGLHAGVSPAPAPIVVPWTGLK